MMPILVNILNFTVVAMRWWSLNFTLSMFAIHEQEARLANTITIIIRGGSSTFAQTDLLIPIWYVYMDPKGCSDACPTSQTHTHAHITLSTTAVVQSIPRICWPVYTPWTSSCFPSTNAHAKSVYRDVDVLAILPVASEMLHSSFPSSLSTGFLFCEWTCCWWLPAMMVKYAPSYALYLRCLCVCLSIMQTYFADATRSAKGLHTWAGHQTSYPGSWNAASKWNALGQHGRPFYRWPQSSWGHMMIMLIWEVVAVWSHAAVCLWHGLLNIILVMWVDKHPVITQHDKTVTMLSQIGIKTVGF